MDFEKIHQSLFVGLLVCLFLVVFFLFPLFLISYLFPVEVEARGYCSRSILCCFKSLGLRNPTINTTIKQLSKCSMECSFCIWLARNNKAWSFKDIDLSLKTPEDPLVHQNLYSTTSKTNSLKPNPPSSRLY